jgi:hypothetical protein
VPYVLTATCNSILIDPPAGNFSRPGGIWATGSITGLPILSNLSEPSFCTRNSIEWSCRPGFPLMRAQPNIWITGTFSFSFDASAGTPGTQNMSSIRMALSMPLDSWRVRSHKNRLTDIMSGGSGIGKPVYQVVLCALRHSTGHTGTRHMPLPRRLALKIHPNSPYVALKS